MRRIFAVLCLAALLVTSFAMPISAEEFDPARKGSITVTLIEREEQHPIAGAALAVYYVASAEMSKSGILNYTYTDSFAGCGIDLFDRDLSAKLDAYVSGRSIESIRLTTDENGAASCADLPLGLYFVKQIGNAEGFAPCTPFVVTVPFKTNDGYVYDVDASPKTDVVRLIAITIKKVWNTDESTKAADSVKVQLILNGKVIKTATLSDANNWTVTYNGLPKSDGYEIKEVNVPKGFTATYTQNGYEFTVTNTSSLIQTGQLLWPIPVLAMAGLFLLLAGVLILRKTEKTHA